MFEGGIWGGVELFVVVCFSKPQLSVTFVYGNHEDRSLQMKLM